MSEGYRDNKLLFQKCHRALLEHTSDVEFIFENDNVKILANRVVLAASSPVFDAMFNGKLKEKGNVKITDASPEAFRAFLQFFYDSQVKLTVENIVEVLKLVDKYDVADCWPVCSGFLMDNAQIENILLTLYLAIEYNLDDLKTFCEQKISQNYQAVIDMIHFENGQLRLAPQNRLLDNELEKIMPYIFAISKNVFSNHMVKLNSAILPITLTIAQFTTNYVLKNETIQFSINEPMLLADIICSDIATHGMGHIYATHSFEISIDERPNSNSRDIKTLHTQNLTIESNGIKIHHVELQSPIRIEPDQIYTITFSSDTTPKGLCTQKAKIPDTPVEFAPGIRISFPQDRSYIRSLVSQLHFKYA